MGGFLKAHSANRALPASALIEVLTDRIERLFAGQQVAKREAARQTTLSFHDA
jgi:hypothetical protein